MGAPSPRDDAVVHAGATTHAGSEDAFITLYGSFGTTSEGVIDRRGEVGALTVMLLAAFCYATTVFGECWEVSAKAKSKNESESKHLAGILIPTYNMVP